MSKLNLLMGPGKSGLPKIEPDGSRLRVQAFAGSDDVVL